VSGYSYSYGAADTADANRWDQESVCAECGVVFDATYASDNADGETVGPCCAGVDPEEQSWAS
jgi:hypothetical protein